MSMRSCWPSARCVALRSLNRTCRCVKTDRQPRTFAMEAAIALIQDTLYEQRSIQPRFREAQLDALFKALQNNGDQLIEAAESEAAGSRARIEEELELVLEAIAQCSRELPGVDDWWKGQTRLQDAVGVRELPFGSVAIQANTHHPIGSIVIPLMQAVREGNGALVSVTQSALHRRMASFLRNALDKELFHFLHFELEDASSRCALVGLADAKSRKASKTTGYRPAFGPVPVLVDQSCLEGKKRPTPLANASYPIPKLLRKAASDLRETFAFESQTRKAAAWRSTTSPSYVLCHENILALFQRALVEAGIETAFQVQPFNRAGDLLSVLPSPTALQYVPIFPYPSIDSAMDFIANGAAPKPTSVFLYAAPAFCTYAAAHLPCKDIVVGGIPKSVIALGPYRRPSDMSFTTRKHIELAKPKGSRTGKAIWRSVTPKVIERRAGKRVDFFFSGILLSFGTTASVLLGLTGYGLFRAVSFGMAQYARA